MERRRRFKVVGEQPAEAPAILRDTSMPSDPVGTMHGTYQMVTKDVVMDAVIAPFTLAVPTALN